METTTLPQVGTWTLDDQHSRVGFVAKHLMVTKVRGAFTSYSGTIDVADPIEESTVSVEIDAASIETGTADRDGHLKSGDFLDVENHPKLTFRSTGIRRDGADFKVDGDLTIVGVTRPVTLDVEFDGEATDPWGNTKAGFTASTTIDRTEWGLTWNATLESGGVLVSKDIKIEIEAQAALQA